MESDDDHHTTAPADQKPTNGDDDEVEQAGESKVVIITRSRSYECNFCKRGFSNAQALGGHMNIHRKDKKAKLKKTSTSGQTTHQPLFSLNNIHHKVPSLWHANSGHEEGSSYPKNWPTNRKVTLTLQDHETDLLLPLFADSPVNNSKEAQKPDGQLVHDEIIITAERGLSSELLDLELRLGPDPDEDQDYSSATKTGTRKLF